MIHHCLLTYKGSWSVHKICSSDPLTGSLNLLKVSASALPARGKTKHSLPYRMQSFEDPWTEEDNEATEHPYYNNIPNKIPPPGGFLDARLKTRLPTAADTAQVSIISTLLLIDPKFLKDMCFMVDTLGLSITHSPSCVASFHPNGHCRSRGQHIRQIQNKLKEVKSSWC